MAKKKTSKKATKKSAKKVYNKANKKATKTAIKKSAKKAAKKVVRKATKKITKKNSKGLVKKVAKKLSAKAPKKVIKKTKKKIVTKKVSTKKQVKPLPKAPRVVKTKPTEIQIIEPKPTFVAHHTSLVAGMQAPDFNGMDQNGHLISLNDLKGKTIILYFYPKDDTDGCTAQACSLRDEYKYLHDKNYVVIGVSADDEATHAKFAEKYSLPFSLIADTEMEMIKAYDVWGTKQLMGRIYDGIVRTTFIINPEGVIKEIITKVNTQQHAQQILELESNN